MSRGGVAGSLVTQGDLVRLGDGASLDGSQSLAETLASLPQELERIGEVALRSGAFWISLVLFDEVCLQGRSDLVGRLERLIDGPFPRDVVHHVASIPHGRLRLIASPGTRAGGHRAAPGPPQPGVLNSKVGRRVAALTMIPQSRSPGRDAPPARRPRRRGAEPPVGQRFKLEERGPGCRVVAAWPASRKGGGLSWR